MNHTPSVATLSDVVGTALADTNLSDRQIEAATGVSRTTLKRKLANGDKFTIGELERIADLLGIKLSELIARTEGRAA